MAVKRTGLLRVSVRKMKAQTVKMDKVTLIDKGGWNLTCFVYSVNAINSKTFFLRRSFIFWGVVLD